MLHVQTKTPLKGSKQTSAAAAKIKNKILNTSSFFKVSLKTNNKALALALEAQKGRNRQLEREIVCLQKQREALCFELASRKYKDRKLLLILKSLHSNTLQHFDMVADIFSDSDFSKPSEHNKNVFGDIKEDNPALSRLTDDFHPQLKNPAVLCPSKKKTGYQQNVDERVASVQSRHVMTTDIYMDNTDAEGRFSSYQLPTPQTGTSCPSSSLREEVDRLSMIFSQSGFDMKSAPCSQTHTTVSTCEKSSLCGSVSCPEPDAGSTREKTVLLNSTMEMTLSNSDSIVTVETKATTTGKGNRTEACRPSVKSSVDCRMSEAQSGFTDDVSRTDELALEEVIKPRSPKDLCRSVIPSCIPKLSKTDAGKNQKMAKNKFRSRDPAKPETCDTALTGLDDFFTDPDINLIKARQSVKLRLETDIAEEAVSKITCRRSRTKGRRKTFVTLSPRKSESRGSKLEQLYDEAEVVEKNDDACEDQERAEGSCADEATRSDSEHVGLLSLRGSEVANYGASLQPRCRGTFVISVAMDSTSSRCEAEESSAVADRGVLQQRSASNPHSDRALVGDTQSSCKRPWVATQDPGSCREVLGSGSNHNEPLDQDCSTDTEFQKTKKPRRSETSKSGHRDEWDGLFNDRRNKSSSRNKGFRCEDESRYVQESSQVSACCDNDSSSSVISGKEDILEQLHDSKPTKSMSRVDVKPRKKSKLHTPTETRNLRETFVVCRRKTPNIRTPDASDACSDEAFHQTVGDLLMDEMPPWLAVDLGSPKANAVVDSLLPSPTREALVPASVTEESAVTADASPAGIVLTSLTNIITTSDSDNGGRTRRRNGVVSYKEPPLNSKIRRGDKFTDSMFLSSPVFKDGKKKRQKKNVKEPVLERSLFID